MLGLRGVRWRHRQTGQDLKALEEQMSVYAAYHRNRWNRLTHFIGVPAIVFAILVPMAWVDFGEGITLAHLFAAATLAYYFALDVPLALAMTVVIAALLLAAESAAAAGMPAAWVWSGTFFVGGWALQLAGHAFEGRKPALMDNLFQVLIAPIFLMAELFFALGFKRDVQMRVETRLAGNDPAS
jgi:uncharacterized membrane protein YGL010W